MPPAPAWVPTPDARPDDFVQPVRPQILTVALEDYYHVGAFNRLIQRGQWYRFERRVEQSTMRTLDLLDEFGARATFFILGWIAETLPELIRLVADRGHEIASKGYYHRNIRQLTPTEFRDDLARAREAIERTGGRKVVGYRVADDWFRPEDLWALDVLAEEGYEYDSSIGPILRSYAAEPWRRFAHLHRHGGRTLWELPISTADVFGFLIPIAGGNYFRQFPHWIVRRAVAHWLRTYTAPFVMYFHTWEMDPDQPRIRSAPFHSRIRQYRHLDRMPQYLGYYLSRYRFTSAATYLELTTRGATAHPERLEDASGGMRRIDARTRRVPGAARELLLTPPTAAAADSATLPAESKVLPAPPPLQPLSALAPPPPPPPPAQPSASPPEPPSEQQADERSAVMTRVTVVIPCYNEELILPYLANTLASVEARLATYAFTFVFVDDRSTDATWDALRRIFGARPNCVLVQHPENRGVAAGILTGINAATTDVVCSMDCDCTYDPHELGRMIPLLTDGIDLVTASPYHRDGHVRNVPRWRLALSKSLSRLYRLVLHHKLATYTSCFRVYRRSACSGFELEQTGFLGVAEMLAGLDLAGSKIVEFPTTLEVRMIGRSKMRVLRTIGGHLRLLTRLSWRRFRA